MLIKTKKPWNNQGLNVVQRYFEHKSQETYFTIESATTESVEALSVLSTTVVSESF